MHGQFDPFATTHHLARHPASQFSQGIPARHGVDRQMGGNGFDSRSEHNKSCHARQSPPRPPIHDTHVARGEITSALANPPRLTTPSASDHLVARQLATPPTRPTEHAGRHRVQPATSLTTPSAFDHHRARQLATPLTSTSEGGQEMLTHSAFQARAASWLQSNNGRRGTSQTRAQCILRSGGVPGSRAPARGGTGPTRAQHILRAGSP